MKRTIQVPDKHTPNAPAQRMGLIEATIKRVLGDGAAIVLGDNGRTYRIDASGVAVEEIQK